MMDEATRAAILRMMGSQTFPPPAPPNFTPWQQPINSLYQTAQALIPNLEVQARGGSIPPWMIPPPAQGDSNAPAISAPPPAAAPTNGADSSFADAEAETAKREAIVNQLGDFSRRVLTSKALIGE